MTVESFDKQGEIMKIVGIGTELKMGKVMEITREGVVIDCKGKRIMFTFSQIESEVFGG